MRGISIYITEALFNNIYKDPVYGNVFDGSGIYASGGRGNFTIKQAGFGNSSTSTPSFIDCNIGIYTERMNTSIVRNRMVNLNNGIREFYGTYLSGYIADNLIDCNYYGVDLRQNDGSLGITVTRNNVNLGFNPTYSPKSIAIRSLDNGSTADNIIISANRVYVKNGGIGIACSNSRQINVLNNSVELQIPSFNRYGIFQSNCSKSLIGCNSINSLGISSNQYQSGIYTSISYGTMIECNSVDNTYNGFRFDGVSNSADLAKNIIQNHTYGLYYGTTGVTGPQLDRGNQWTGTYGLAGALHTGNYTLSKYYVNPFTSPNIPVVRVPSLNWFLQSAGAIPFCNSNVDCAAHLANGSIDQTELIIADTDFPTPDYLQETNWMADKFLYEKLIKDPSLASGSTILTNFLNAKQATPIGEFTEVKGEMDGLYDLLAGLPVQLSQNAITVDQKFTAIESNMTLLQQGGLTEAQENAIMTVIKQLQLDISALQNAIKTVIDPILQNKDIEADNIKNANDAIISQQQIEDNEKVVNRIYLETIGKGIYDFSSQDASDLLSISEQCAFAGGVAVYRARAIYSLIDGEADFDDFDICTALGIQLRTDQSASTSVGVFSAPLVIPNPANNYADVFFEMDADHSGNIDLFNQLGEIVRSIPIDGTIRYSRIELSDLNSGVYYVSVNAGGKSSLRTKLVIIK